MEDAGKYEAHLLDRFLFNTNLSSIQDWAKPSGISFTTMKSENGSTKEAQGKGEMSLESYKHFSRD